MVHPVVARVRDALPVADEAVVAPLRAGLGFELAPARDRLPWFSYLLDSARTFWPLPVIYSLVDDLARYGVSLLHWHLTDNQAWRPRVGGVDSATGALGRMDYANYDVIAPDKRAQYWARARALGADGMYTPEDMRAVVDYAAARGIAVLPEIDLPGHMGALLVTRPELGQADLAVDGDPRTENMLLWPRPATFDFLAGVLEQVATIFPFPLVHIGGDECEVERWERDDEARAFMRAHGLHTGADLQNYFTDFAREVLGGAGRGLVGWDELAGHTSGADDVLMGWRPEKGVLAARASGRPWVYMDCNRTYFNKVQGDPQTEPPGMESPITAADVANALIPAGDPRIVGVGCAVWSEFVTNEAELRYQLHPRLAVLAQRVHALRVDPGAPALTTGALAELVEAETARRNPLH